MAAKSRAEARGIVADGGAPCGASAATRRMPVIPLARPIAGQYLTQFGVGPPLLDLLMDDQRGV